MSRLKGDKRIALKIVDGLMGFVKQGWTQGASKRIRGDGGFDYCLSGACGEAVLPLERELSSADRQRVYDAMNRVEMELARLASARMRRHGVQNKSGYVDYNDLSTTLKKDVISLVNKARQNIATGADFRAIRKKK